MVKLSASVICADHLNLIDDLIQCHQSGIEQFHFDVMDGNYVPRFGLYPEILVKIKENFSIPVDVHIMISEPEKYVELFANSGADIFTFHIESTNHPTRLIDKIIKNKMKPGIALNPATPTSSIKDLIGLTDYILLMMIDPGVLGSPVYDFVYDKILETKFFFVEKNRPVEPHRSIGTRDRDRGRWSHLCTLHTLKLLREYMMQAQHILSL
jgi:ribulose-phosphate 3-epimerase